MLSIKKLIERLELYKENASFDFTVGEVQEMINSITSLEEDKQCLEDSYIERAFAIVAPVAAMVGVTDKETMTVLKFFREMQKSGVRGHQAGTLLRQYLIGLQK